MFARSDEMRERLGTGAVLRVGATRGGGRSGGGWTVGGGGSGRRHTDSRQQPDDVPVPHGRPNVQQGMGGGAVGTL